MARRSTRRTTRYAAPRRSYKAPKRKTYRKKASRASKPRTIRIVIQTVSASPLLGAGNQMVKGAQITRRMF